jgi:hypothetical protein
VVNNGLNFSSVRKSIIALCDLCPKIHVWKLKFKINRSNLPKLYLVYIRPIFEYASEVWDNCRSVNASKLERLQLEAAIIVTSLPVFANSNFIFLKWGIDGRWNV